MSSAPAWVHCNLCKSQSFKALFLTSCGKTVCGQCRPRLADITCNDCKGPCTRTIEINANAPEEVQSLFGDASSKLKSAFKCINFQERQKKSILDNLRREIESLENQIQEELEADQEEERLYNEMLAEYKEVCKQEAILKAEVEQLLKEVGTDDGHEVGGAVGGILSPLEYPDRSSSSSSGRRDRAKPTNVLSPSSFQSPPPSSEKPFLQMKTPAAWYKHKRPKNSPGTGGESPVMTQLQALEEVPKGSNNLSKQCRKFFNFFSPN